MKRMRLTFALIVCMAVAIIIAGRRLSLLSWSFKQPEPTVDLSAPTPVFERQSARLPDLRKLPAEEPLRAEVRDVMPLFTSLGSVYFIGEIVNTGQCPIAKPEIIIVLRDAKGDPLLFETGYPIHDIVQPGEVVPVVVLFTDPPPVWYSFSAYIQARIPTGREFMTYTAFAYDDVEISKDEFSYFIFTGNVENIGPSKAEFAQAVVSLYDENDKLVATNSAYVEHNALDPGARSPFTVRVTNVLAPAAYYRLQFVAHAR